MVSVKVIQGRQEIGGNCIRIEDRDRVLLFDQGLRFSIIKRYYTHRIEPMGIPELRSIGAIPSLSAYENVEAIYITHFHLDHLGLLYNVPEIKVMIPSLDTFKLMEKWYRAAPSWFKFIPPSHRTPVEEVTSLKATEHDVLAIPVMHGTYPSYAYMYFGSDETILYTGDLRLTPISEAALQKLHSTTLKDFLENEKDLKVDHLILEGTNVGKVVAPLPRGFLGSALSRLIAPDVLALLVLHHHELELAMAAILELQKLDKSVVLVSEKLAEFLDLWARKLNLKLGNVAVFSIAVESPVDFDLVSEDEIRLEPQRYILLADIWHIVDALRMFQPEELPTGSPAILLASETEGEEFYGGQVALRWLHYYHFQPYKLLISGHYYPYELKELLKLVKPKKLTPIHTRHPSIIYELHNALR